MCKHTHLYMFILVNVYIFIAFFGIYLSVHQYIILVCLEYDRMFMRINADKACYITILYRCTDVIYE